MPKFQGAVGEVYYRHWASSRPRAQIVFLHGYGEHSALYHRFGDFMNAHGIDVWALDAIGHGLSDGDRGNPGCMDDLCANAERMTQIALAARRGLPVSLVGHSMGAMTAATLLLRDVRPFIGVVFGGMPIEGIDKEQEQKAAQGVMSLDPFYLDELEFDPLKFDGAMAFTHLGTLFSEQVVEKIKAGLPRIPLPVLMISGDQDIFCPPELARRWASKIHNAEYHLFIDTYHDLLNDICHEDVAKLIANTVLGWSDNQQRQ